MRWPTRASSSQRRRSPFRPPLLPVSASLLAEQPKLEQSRSVEAVDLEQRSCSRSRCSRGHEPDELGADDLDPPRRRFARYPREDVMERGRLPVLDVHAHLDTACPGQFEAERSHAGEPAVSLADDRGNRARILDRSAAQIDVERDQWAAGSDDDAAGTGMELGRAEVNGELCLGQATSQLRGSAPAEE